MGEVGTDTGGVEVIVVAVTDAFSPQLPLRIDPERLTLRLFLY